jgi:hypothetical protein
VKEDILKFGGKGVSPARFARGRRECREKKFWLVTGCALWLAIKIMEINQGNPFPN